MPIDRKTLQIVIVDPAGEGHDDLASRLYTSNLARVQAFDGPDPAKEAIAHFSGPTLIIFYLPVEVHALVNHVRFFRRGLQKRVEVIFVAPANTSETIEKAYRELGALAFVRNDNADFIAVQVEQAIESASSFRYKIDPGGAHLSSSDVHRSSDAPPPVRRTTGGVGLTPPPLYDPSATGGGFTTPRPPAGAQSEATLPHSQPGRSRPMADAEGTGQRRRALVTAPMPAFEEPSVPLPVEQKKPVRRVSEFATPPGGAFDSSSGGGRQVAALPASFPTPITTDSPAAAPRAGIPLLPIAATAGVTALLVAGVAFFLLRPEAPTPAPSEVVAENIPTPPGLEEQAASIPVTPSTVIQPVPVATRTPLAWPSTSQQAAVAGPAGAAPRVAALTIPQIRASLALGSVALGETVSTEGTVIMGGGGFVPHRQQFILSAQGAGLVVDDQDLLGVHKTATGDRVRITGILGDYRGTLQVRLTGPTQLLPGKASPQDLAPRPLTIPELGEAVEGTLAAVADLTYVSTESALGTRNFVYQDRSGNKLGIYIDADTAIAVPPPRSISVLIGIVYQFNDSGQPASYLLYPRSKADVVAAP